MANDDLTTLALDDARSRMHGAVDALTRDLQGIRTGRAHPALVEHLPIDYYGTSMALNQMANITVPEARMIVIQPWDKNAFDPIQKGLQLSDLGINPQSDGVVIRLILPDLTEERRRQLVKQVGGKVEEARVAVRNVRRHIQDDLRKLQKDGDISQDEEHRAHDTLEKITHDAVSQVDAVGSEKERELMEV